MKKLFIALYFIGLILLIYDTLTNDTKSAIASPAPIYDDLTCSGCKVVSTGSSEKELQFVDLQTATRMDKLIYIQVDADNSGTIQFSAGRSITSAFVAYPAGAKVPITIRNGFDNLRYKASGSGQEFSVTH